MALKAVPKYLLHLTTAGAFVGGIVLFKEYIGGSNFTLDESLSGRVVVVTGANTGIGRETALALAKKKARVIMACRDMDKCLKARKDIALESRNKHIYCEECDLASQESVRNFAKLINHKTGHSFPILSACTTNLGSTIQWEERLDILINNAGVMRCKKAYTKEGIELQLGTNHMGHFLLTLLLLDKLKASAPSRIINVSSVAHRHGRINFSDLNSDKKYDEGEAYAQSKLANILFTTELSERLEGTGVTCNAVHPGLVYTDLGRHMSLYKSWLAVIFLHPFLWLFLKTPRQGAQNTLYVALNPRLERVSGKYFSIQLETELLKNAQDREAAKRLWAISERWTGLS